MRWGTTVQFVLNLIEQLLTHYETILYNFLDEFFYMLCTFLTMKMF